ncbi:DUF4190 domain-containing protein [Nocardia uniformis]|uniref:DUF4190 domain-containing protein n=2 Tax=Nocardia uniformis TaxID=53432 RepID=A0A849C8Y3_9NOCA|nr:DUF4190 domain-containing protein [Nocardia uniformis]
MPSDYPLSAPGGVYGTHPYYPGVPPGYPPGVPPQRPGTNGLAIAALITGVLGMCLFAIPFGLIALSQIRSRGQAGRGLAIGGLVASSLWVLVAVGGFAGGALLSDDTSSKSVESSASVDGPGSISIFDVKVGDCIQDGVESDRVGQVTVVPCDQPHHSEAITEVFLDGSWPGVSEVKQQAADACTATLGEMLAESPMLEQLRVFVLYPSNEARWKTSTKVTCSVVDANGGKLTGTVPR